MKNTYLLGAFLLFSPYVFSQKYAADFFFGRWVVVSDSVFCDAGTFVSDKSKGQTITFFKDRTIESSAPPGSFFADLALFSVDLHGRYISMMTKSDQIRSFTPEISGDTLRLYGFSEKSLCGANDNHADVHRTLVRDTTAKPIELIGENEIVSEMDVEKKAEFSGGEAKMLAWVHKNLKLPKLETGDLTSLEISMSFVVEKDGKISKPDVWGKGLTEENKKQLAQQLLKMPRWHAAEVGGQPVRAGILTQVEIKLEK